MARRSLGPFPKFKRWRELACVQSLQASPDDLLQDLINRYQELATDDQALRAITFLVALPICSRALEPLADLRERFAISLASAERVDVMGAILSELPEESSVRAALIDACEIIFEHNRSSFLFEADPWNVWREYDGPAFCDLARTFFWQLNVQSFAALLAQPADAELRRFSFEASLITRSFSARWFNACARFHAPDPGSIRWYFGHCLGKLELELERELSDWVEPVGKPWKRKRPNFNTKLAIDF